MLTNEDIQALKKALEPEFTNIKERLDRMESDISEMKNDISELKEDTEITRGATEEILEWLNIHYSDDKLKRFPVPSEAEEEADRIIEEINAKASIKPYEKKG